MLGGQHRFPAGNTPAFSAALRLGIKEFAVATDRQPAVLLSLVNAGEPRGDRAARGRQRVSDLFAHRRIVMAKKPVVHWYPADRVLAEALP